MREYIKIGGAGISGLTAAITLARAGYKVKVLEEGPDVEIKRHGDTQHLENWTTKKDILDILKEMGLKKDFSFSPFKIAEFYSPKSEKLIVKTKMPMAYSVRRGPFKGSIDYSLKKQAIDEGVEIVFNKKIKEEEVEIVATGAKKIMASAFGVTFKANIPDKIIVIFDDILSPKGYSYFSSVNHDVTMACTFDLKKTNMEEHLDSTIKRFEEITKIKIKNSKKFAGFVNFSIPKSAKIGKRLYVGEAAGFQDALAGFGMRYALRSGYLAAMSIITGENYDELWKEDFYGTIVASHVNRFLFENADKLLGYDEIIRLTRLLIEKRNVDLFMNAIYNLHFYDKIIIPLAKKWMKERFG